MARRKRSNRRTKRTRKAAKRRRRTRLPKAFRIVPIELTRRITPHAHTLDAPGVPPCPSGSVFDRRIKIDQTWFCVYVTENGGQTMIECP